MIDKGLEEAVASRLNELSRDVPDIDAMKERIRNSLTVETEQQTSAPRISRRLWLTAAAAILMCGSLILAGLASRQDGESLIAAGPGDSTPRASADVTVYPSWRFDNVRNQARQADPNQGSRVFEIPATAEEVVETLTDNLFDVDVTSVEDAAFAGLETTLVSMETRRGTTLVGFTLSEGFTLSAPNVDRSFRIHLVSTETGVVAFWFDTPRAEIEAAMGAAEIEVTAALLGD